MVRYGSALLLATQDVVTPIGDAANARSPNSKLNDRILAVAGASVMST